MKPHQLIGKNLKKNRIIVELQVHSIIYTEIGNMGKTYNQYLLKVSLIENNKIYLKYDKTLNGYTVNANKGNYFGIVTSEQKALLFESEYLSEKFDVDKTFMNK